MAFLRGSLHGAHITNANQGHVKSAGNRSSAQGKDVHLSPQLLEPFLVSDAKSLLLINDHQPEVLEGNVLLNEAMSAYTDIDATVG